MNPIVPVIGEVIGKVGQIADDLFTSDEERARAGIDAYKAETDRMHGQVEINKIEAGHRSLFVAGWRPAVGWVGVIAMLYQFVAYPFLTWAWTAMQAAGWISIGLLPPPQLETDSLWVILTGILGLGVYRTAERLKDKA